MNSNPKYCWTTFYRAYKCGVSRSAQSKIMGGLDAGYGQFPWTAHIKIRGPYGIDKVSGWPVGISARNTAV